MRLESLLDGELLHWCLANGYVTGTRHASEPLTIYNYTPATQYERRWNAVTMQCRGLIVSDDGEVVARPLRKFFNLDEHAPEEIPAETFEVFEKLDGSLGIAYWWKDELHVATRGSFRSDQAQEAERMMHDSYETVGRELPRGHTHHFEIIYPENRIVVDYGDRRELVHLASVDIETGMDAEFGPDGFPSARRYDGPTDLTELRGLEEKGREGYVVRFRSGLRVKVKFVEYLRLHRIVTNASTRSIWECLKSGDGLDRILDRVPDEFYRWTKRVRHELVTAYRAVEEQCCREFRMLPTRKETAHYFRRCSHPEVLFLMLDGKDYSAALWELVRPVYARPQLHEERR